jgi:hypothetical protein
MPSTPRYQIWNKTDSIYTLAPDETGKAVFTPEEWISKYPWAGIPGVKSVIGGGVINGTVMMQFDQTVDFYRDAGAEITDGMTDQEILDAIEHFETHPPEAEPSPEERMAAALEYQALMG